ncbi:MAG: histidine kinase N-terminal domain-containing protein, partial [Acidimicrobiales bacterium]
MTSPLDLSWRDARLGPEARLHLDRLTASWNLLADLCFSDLLLYVPIGGLPPAPTEAAPTEAAPTEAAPTEAAPTEAAPTEAAPTEAAPT